MSEPMEQDTPKDWSPRSKEPWVKYGHESWEFADPISWLVYEAANKGHNSYVNSQYGSGGSTHYRFDGNKLWKVLPDIAKAFGWTLDNAQDLDPLKDMKGAIIEVEGDDAAEVEFYWNKAELRGDWADIRERTGPDRW